MHCKRLIPKLLITALLITAPIVGSALANAIDDPSGKPGHPPGPPPEFYEACEGKTPGDIVMIETPRGDQIESVCEKKGDQLVARPLNPPPPPSENGHESPSERK